MSTFLDLLPVGEDRWAAASTDEKKAGYAAHGEFTPVADRARAPMVSGAELTPSAQAKVVRGALNNVTITDGPYAPETAEHVTGFYLIETDDPDDLLQVCGRLAEHEQVLEVRRCVDSERP